MLKVNDLQRHHSSLQADLRQTAVEVLSSGWYVLGQRVSSFERAFAEFCGTKDAVGVGNGTDALELSLRALGVAAGDGVATVANAGMYSSTAILAVGARPIFVDVDASSMTMDPAALDVCLSPACKAIVLTHLYGRLGNVDAIVGIARSRGVPIIEDCAQAHGAAYGGRRAGGFGALGCFSFYPTKNLGACGDGGAITTSDPELAAKVRRLRQYGWSEKYTVAEEGGRNTRLDELQAAFLSLKLPMLSSWNDRRRAIARAYSSRIRHELVQVADVHDDSYVAHLYVVRAGNRESLREHLRGCEIATEIHYPVPDHKQPALADRFRHVHLPITERIATEVLTLPCFPEMTDAEVDHVIASCNAWQP
jgi:dTDP-4-amino-4,6-dideoxygalactose transaminase